MILNWKMERHEVITVSAIVKRAMEFAKQHDYNLRGIDLTMDISACHLNGCPLQLEELANAPDFDFVHDVFGIHRHINRNTGKLERCFLPRYAKREVTA